jgi:hypothetical protein
MTRTIVVCAVCRLPLAPGEALEVTTISTGEVRHIHRPGVILAGVPTGACFAHGVGPHSRDRVRLADPDAAWARDARGERP